MQPPAIRHNLRIYYLQSAVFSGVTTLGSGAILQTFMLECGYPQDTVSLVVAISQLVQSLGMLALSRRLESVRRIHFGMALSLVPFVPFFGILLWLTLSSALSTDARFWWLLVSYVLLNLFWAVHNVLIYKLPHAVMPMRDYGRASGQAGVFCGLVGIALSAAMSFFTKRSGYLPAITVFWIIGLLAALASCLLCLVFRPLHDTRKVSGEPPIRLFRYKPFYALIIPNVSRGFSQGIFNLVTVIGYDAGILTPTTAILLTAITHIATLSSCQAYALLATRRGSGLIVLVSSLLFAVASPLMMLGSAPVPFLLLYFVAFFCVNCVSYGVPVLVANRIDYACLGQYTAWRMALFTLGMAAGSACVPALLSWVGPTGTLLLCGITLLPCGIGYYLFEKSTI